MVSIVKLVQVNKEQLSVNTAL